MNQKDTVKRLLDGKVIDFVALGRFIGEVGPSLALEDEPWDWFCGTGPHVIRLIQISGPGGLTVNPSEFAGAGEELNG